MTPQLRTPQHPLARLCIDENTSPVGGGVMLGTYRADSVVTELQPGTGSVRLVTDRPDALLERARAAGTTVVQEPRDEGFGSRSFTVRDPEGVSWNLGTYGGA